MGRQLLQFASLIFLLGVPFPRQAASAETRDGILILSVLRDGKPDAELQSLLTEHLSLEGQPVVGSSLSAEEKSCQQADCMSLIIQKRPGVGRLLRADIETMAVTAPTDGQGVAPTYKIAVSGFLLEGRKSWSRSAFCTPCANHKALTTTLKSVAVQTLSGPPAASALEPATPLTAPHSSWSRARIATVATLAVVSAGTLIAGGVLVSLNGQATSAYSCMPSQTPDLPVDPHACLYRTLPFGGTLLGVGAATGITAITLSLAWPGSRKLPKKTAVTEPEDRLLATETTDPEARRKD